MSTAQHIINRAFSKSLIRAAETPLEATETQDGLDVLNDLLAEWDATGVLKGAEPVKYASDILSVPRYAEGALKANLALRLCNEFDKPITPGLLADATDSLASLQKASIDLTPEFPSTLPIGSGNQTYDYNYDVDFFPSKGKENF